MPYTAIYSLYQLLTRSYNSSQKRGSKKQLKSASIVAEDEEPEHVSEAETAAIVAPIDEDDPMGDPEDDEPVVRLIIIS